MATLGELVKAITQLQEEVVSSKDLATTLAERVSQLQDKVEKKEQSPTGVSWPGNQDLGGHSKFGGRRSPPAKLTPPNDRSAVKRPQGPFRLSRWAGGRPPKERPPAQRERPCNTEAGSEWSRRCCRGATGAVAPVAIFTVCYADSENHAGALLGGPCTAHASGMGSAGAPRGPTTPVPAILFLAVKTARNRLAGRGSESVWRRCLQRRHGGFSQPGLIRRETAGPGWATAALQPRSECQMKHRQPVGGASDDIHPGGHRPPGLE
ncbi:hypothetical protein NDU88_003618 [Pleurodeles waltl]|uniref:Uncharacterized protein n=1 Tax=Pleurodeles waltl TaxID=8319 RepID=A0AAV7UDC1_PLEWA|nr:hypothetical protein NDU88_003618 [Pleurodeles waltl]